MYIIFGAATTLVSLVVYYLCTHLFFDVGIAWQLQASNVISWVISVLFAFVTNKLFVFRSNASTFNEFVKFYLARIGTLLIDMFLMYVTVTVCNFKDMISKTSIQVIVIILNYAFGKLFVFNKKSNC